MRCQGKKGIKGHSIPCQYHVLHKDHRLSDFGTGDLQVVTYQLCHMYARGDKTVSYASLAYVADLCAELGKQKLHVVSQMHTSIITLLELAPKQAVVPRPQGPTS